MLTERDVRREGFELFGFQALCNAVSRINKGEKVNSNGQSTDGALSQAIKKCQSSTAGDTIYQHSAHPSGDWDVVSQQQGEILKKQPRTITLNDAAFDHEMQEELEQLVTRAKSCSCLDLSHAWLEEEFKAQQELARQPVANPELLMARLASQAASRQAQPQAPPQRKQRTPAPDSNCSANPYKISPSSISFTASTSDSRLPRLPIGGLRNGPGKGRSTGTGQAHLVQGPAKAAPRSHHDLAPHQLPPLSPPAPGDGGRSNSFSSTQHTTTTTTTASRLPRRASSPDSVTPAGGSFTTPSRSGAGSFAGGSRLYFRQQTAPQLPSVAPPAPATLSQPGTRVELFQRCHACWQKLDATATTSHQCHPMPPSGEPTPQQSSWSWSVPTTTAAAAAAATTAVGEPTAAPPALPAPAPAPAPKSLPEMLAQMQARQSQHSSQGGSTDACGKGLSALRGKAGHSSLGFKRSQSVSCLPRPPEYRADGQQVCRAQQQQPQRPLFNGGYH